MVDTYHEAFDSNKNMQCCHENCQNRPILEWYPVGYWCEHHIPRHMLVNPQVNLRFFNKVPVAKKQRVMRSFGSSGGKTRGVW